MFESISEEKQTRMGPGRFVTWVTTYTVEPGEVVGRQTLPHPEVRPVGPRHERHATRTSGRFDSDRAWATR